MTTEGRKEEILYKAHPPMFRNHPVWFTISVLLIAAFGLGIVILVIWWIASISHSLTITARELRYEVGILSKSRSELQLSGIRSVRVNQSVAQRIFRTGDIEVFTAGDSPEIVARGMPDPARIRALI